MTKLNVKLNEKVKARDTQIEAQTKEIEGLKINITEMNYKWLVMILESQESQEGEEMPEKKRKTSESQEVEIITIESKEDDQEEKEKEKKRTEFFLGRNNINNWNAITNKYQHQQRKRE